MLVQNAKDRRIFDRFAVQFPARFEQPVSLGQEFPVFLKDASPEGLKFATTHKVSADDVICLAVDLPGTTISLAGRVVWTKPLNPNLCDVGLKFDNVDFKKVQQLYQLSLAA